MILDNIRRKVARIMLIALAVLLCLYFRDLFFGYADRTEWKMSVFDGLPDFVPDELFLPVSIILSLTAGFLIYKINFEHLSITGREHLLVWLWVIQFGGISFLHPLSEVHFATVCILMSYDILFRINTKITDYSAVFLSAMYLGLASLFYGFAVYLFVPYMISLYRFKWAGFRDWIISIAGFLTPFYFAVFAFHFSTGDWSYPITATIDNVVPDVLTLKPVDMSVWQYVFCIFVSILIVAETVMSVKSANRGINRKTISCLRSFSSLMFFSVLIFLLFAPDSRLMLQIIFIPTTVLLRMLFVKINRNIVANSLFVALTAISVIAILLC
ncbi:MAG: hypothetical protein LBQ70_07505 [Prevotellaceae bacterium]|jgi:hypothetical protein|nr:hypothetical protein [Prevotellaceae bacterium]